MASSHLDRQASPEIPLARRQPPEHTAAASAEENRGLAIAVHHHPLPALVVEVTGELDMLTAPRLLDTLHAALREPCPVLVVDLTGVAFMGSAGLAVLAETHEHATPRTTLRIVAPGRATRRPLQITGMDTLLQIYPSRSDALTPPASPPSGHQPG